MRVKQLFFAIAICLLGSGCRLGSYFAHTTIIEPIQFAQNLDKKVEQHRFRRLAEKAFESARAVARAEADDYHYEPFSADMRGGFIDGYVDYVEAGGTGQPPAMPPRRYWKAVYQTREGQLAVQDWFRGFAYGAEMAMASGHRELVTIPLADVLTWSTRPVYQSTRPEEESAAGSEEHHEIVESQRSTSTEPETPILARLPPVISEGEPALFDAASIR